MIDVDYGTSDMNQRAPAVVDQVGRQIDLPPPWTDEDVWNVTTSACSLAGSLSVGEAVESFLAAHEADRLANQVAVVGVPALCPSFDNGFPDVLSSAERLP